MYQVKKKQKEKEVKEKKNREGHGDSLEIDACDVGDHNHIANLVAGLVKQILRTLFLYHTSLLMLTGSIVLRHLVTANTKFVEESV